MASVINTTTSTQFKRRLVAVCMALVIVALGLAASASAETLLMPDRDIVMNTAAQQVPAVLLRVTTLPNHTSGSPTTYSINFGDGSAPATGNVTDRSYIAVNHPFALAGTFTITRQVTNAGITESATATVRVFDPGVES